MKLFITIALIYSCLGFTVYSQEKSVIRLNSTIQPYSAGQPWNKANSISRRALVTYLGEGKVLAPAEVAANASYLEFESVEGSTRIPAKVDVIDYEANLALLTAVTSEGKDKLDSILEPVELAGPSKIGNKVTVLQVESSGVTLKTDGIIRGVEVVSSFVSGNYFLTYEVKASMQSAASSFSVPVFEEGKFLGLLTSYDSKDQLLDVTAPEIIAAFLDDAKDGNYEGFPKIGLGAIATNDQNLRDWLKLDESVGGLYVSVVLPGSPAEDAGIEKADVILSIEGQNIDRQGYYLSEQYGKIHWSHLVRANRKMGDTITASISRKGEKMEKKLELVPTKEGILPAHMHDKAPNYLVKGGLVFQELSKDYLRVFGEKWESRAPLNLLDVYNHPEDYEDGRRRVVFLSGVVPTPATLGYERLRSIVVTKVNGRDVADMKSLISAFEAAEGDIHRIEFVEEPKEIFLSEKASSEVDKNLLQRGIPALSRY